MREKFRMSICIICGKILWYKDGEDEEQPLCKKHIKGFLKENGI